MLKFSTLLNYFFFLNAKIEKFSTLLNYFFFLNAKLKTRQAMANVIPKAARV